MIDQQHCSELCINIYYWSKRFLLWIILDGMKISGSTILTFQTRSPAFHDSNDMSFIEIEKGIFLTQLTKLFGYIPCILEFSFLGTLKNVPVWKKPTVTQILMQMSSYIVKLVFKQFINYKIKIRICCMFFKSIIIGCHARHRKKVKLESHHIFVNFGLVRGAPKSA